MFSFIFKTLLFALILLALASPLSASTVGSARVSSGAFPDFTFQIPIGGIRSITLCQTASDGKLECPGIARYLTLVYQWLVGFAALLAVLAFAWGGIQWLISGGESGKIQEARKVIGNALIGLVLALSSYLLLATIGKDYVAFRPIRIEQVDPLALKLAALAAVPSTSSAATRAAPTARTALPTSAGRDVFVAACGLECTNRGTARGMNLEPVVTETTAGTFDCNCKEVGTGAVCSEPDTELSRQPNCSNIFSAGSVIPPNQYVLRTRDVFTHADSAGTPYYCCSAIITIAPPTCGSKKDQQCCGIPGGDPVCGEGLFPVKKDTFTSENKCFCYSGNKGAVCNAETGQGCAPGLTCQKITGFFGIGIKREDGECK